MKIEIVGVDDAEKCHHHTEAGQQVLVRLFRRDPKSRLPLRTHVCYGADQAAVLPASASLQGNQQNIQRSNLRTPRQSYINTDESVRRIIKA